MQLLVLSSLLTWLLLLLGCWFCSQLLRQNGRMLLRLDELEQQLARRDNVPSTPPALPAGLPHGSAAPEFELPDLTGQRRSLSEFRGRPLLLIFFNPGCGFCTQMAPDLALLPADGYEDAPLPLVITTGAVERNQRLVEEYGWRCRVLRQEATEVASTYQAHGTPMGYLIDADGNIASELAVGAQAVLALVGPTDRPTIAKPQQNGGRGTHEHAHKGNKALADSQIQRNGLPAGTVAPLFQLPRLDGETLTLAEFRGQSVLLVFSDPHCGPCNQLSPRLEQLHRQHSAVRVLMVSRGDVEENRRKVAEHGLTFPVVLQRHWEISRLYGMFSTPIGYLIDAEGVLSSEVAVGADAILAVYTHALSGREQNAPERNCRCGQGAPALPG